MAQMIDAAQRLRIVRQAQREFLRNWADEIPGRAREFQQENNQIHQPVALQRKRLFDDE